MTPIGLDSRTTENQSEPKDSYLTEDLKKEHQGSPVSSLQKVLL